MPVVPIRPGMPVAPPLNPYAELQRRRTDMITAWTAWLATQPSGDSVLLEMDGTHNAMRSLADLILPNRQADLFR